MTRSRHAIAADCVFDGSRVRHDHAIIVDGARIAGVIPRADVPSDMPTRTAPAGAWLSPGFIDLQVNGGGDVLFNDEASAAGLRTIVAAHRRFGTTSLLPTLISDTPEKMRAALNAVGGLLGTEPGILGIHLEGPFLSPERPGVHRVDHIRAPTDEDAELLTSRREGVTLVTLAPERVPKGFVRRLVDSGVRVSLGHSMASYSQTCAALSEGLSGFTHLFNAMRPLASREPGPIAAALERAEVFFGMIVDGVHVDPAMLRLALRGRAVPMLVTDAMPPVGGRSSSFTLYGERIVVQAGRCLRADGTLAGASLDMEAAIRNCVCLLGVPLDVALRFASAHPARFAGVDHWLGRLAPGYRADIVTIDPDEITVIETWVAGVHQRAA